MRRSRTYPTTPKRATDEDDDGDGDEDHEMEFLFAPEERRQHHQQTSNNNSNTAALIHSIASFLTLSDAASLATASHGGAEVAAEEESAAPTPDSWAVGETLEEADYHHHHRSDSRTVRSSWSFSSVQTPLTPALVAVSPGATPRYGSAYTNASNEQHESAHNTSVSIDDDDEVMEELLQQRRRRWAQEKITYAVFSHPRSLRSFCLEAYTAANDIRQQKALAAAHIDDNESSSSSPETRMEPAEGEITATTRKRKRKRNSRNKLLSSGRISSLDSLRAKVIHELVDWIFHNVPVSVLLDVLEAAGVVLIDTTGACLTITISSLHQAVSALGRILVSVWDAVSYCVTNPFALLEAIISLQFNAMGKTSEVLVSGIQSVATGVGSASSLALYKLSATANRSSTSLAGHMNRRNAVGDGVTGSSVLNKRLLKKLSTINDAALVVDYREMQDDTCGLTRHAVSRTRRMMHYSVSLRPFVATIAVPTTTMQPKAEETNHQRVNNSNQGGTSCSPPSDNVPVASIDLPAATARENLSSSYNSGGGGSDEDSSSPFMCTPQSFPPTPHSRQVVIDQRSLVSDDVVFLARDRLRVHDGLESDDARTRERSQALEDGKRLAIFGCNKDSGIELTCGRHIATKVGNLYYASTRSMVSILRNCFVYFELTVLPRPVEAAVATLSIGLSTEEMPPNTLVGAWQGSVGLCTTGQILMAGQWCSPADPAMCAYGTGSTVGCLVCLDDESAFETWDGVMVKATTRFNINGVMVSPPVSTLPMSGAPTSLPTSASAMARVNSPTSDRSTNYGSLGSSAGGERLSPSANMGPPPSRLEPPQATLVLLVPSAEDLYPTVTLQSAATSVVCRFSSEDILASTRDVIGAPPGVAVYAVDGSVILAEDEDSSSS